MDYKKLGLKAGLEVHQQLDTGKLFSRTPSYLRSEKPDYTIKRRLHEVAGEIGEVDVAVSFEASRNKEFVYEGYDDTISLVELDEAPPQNIDEDALDTSLTIALLLNCEIYQTVQIMRKTVIDGSNTSGFQRSVLIGHDGYVETSFGKVGIETVALEEDSARIVERTENRAVYRLDRLGIPLVEITTKPELDSPEKIKESALKIGEILRACRVKRGIGTIRQDVNVSTKGHDRVEIKGFQDPKMMIKTIDIEIDRQKRELKEKKKEGEVRNALPSGETEFLRPLPGKARMYPETDLPLLRISRDKINELKKNLPMLKSEIRDRLRKKGLSGELLNLMIVSVENLDEFEVLLKVCDDANLVAKMVTLWRSELAVKTNQSLENIKENLTEAVLEKILEALKKERIEKGDIYHVMEKIALGENVSDALKVEKVNENELEEKIVKIVKSRPGLRPNAYMGLVMQKLKGKINARKAMEILKRIVEE